MAEYLPNLEEYLQGQIFEAVALIEVRRRFIEALAPLFGRPLEADPIFCRKATFLGASGVFTFLVQYGLDFLLLVYVIGDCTSLEYQAICTSGSCQPTL